MKKSNNFQQDLTLKIIELERKMQDCEDLILVAIKQKEWHKKQLSSIRVSRCHTTHQHDALGELI